MTQTSEIRLLLGLAWPLVMSSLINMSISITDVVMTGWLGQLELAAAAAASDFYSAIYYIALGVIAALSPIIGQALGAKDTTTVRHATQQTLWVALGLCLPGAIIIWHADFFLELLQVKADIVTTGEPYARMMAVSYCFMLLAMVWHYFLSAHRNTRIIFRTVLCILPINALGNYLFMYGKLGLPEMGLAGIGLSSVVCSATMLLIFSFYVFKHYKNYRITSGLFIRHGELFMHILRIGIPIGVINFAELGIFLLSTVIMGTISVETLAAHTVAIRMAGVVYALPLGLSQAAAIRAAYAVGERNQERLFQIGKSALLIAFVTGMGYLLLLSVFADHISYWFIHATHEQTIATAKTYLLLLAVSQPLACIGAIGGGILRGLKDTRAPMFMTLISYWGIGFVTAMSLAFVFNFGGTGIWIGLALSESVMGILMMLRILWWKRNPELTMNPAKGSALM